MTEGRINQMEPRFSLEQFDLLTRLMSIGERLQQTGLHWDNMFQALYTMQQSLYLRDKLPVLRTGPQLVFTYEQLILLTRQLSIHQSLMETGLSECSILHIICSMQENRNTDIDVVTSEEKEDAENPVFGKTAEDDLTKQVDRMMKKNITDKMELNAEIKAFLVTNDVCQEAVAADIGTSQSSFSKFLNHGRGLNSGKRRALYTWYLEQKQTKQALPVQVKEEL
ncbi:homeobox-containing protein 1-like isoform X2 [Branchiostoma floridae]|uniref:Homeobox-containing protein 1-like isoform X2 n=1 Tax=Branchiostoma floridae TaxID=7739 RepID=A0A9J7MBA4_BRAFL|nr:homeobox-containing protein 1-like isoform X2 [Branchiostoma floridae]